MQYHTFKLDEWNRELCIIVMQLERLNTIDSLWDSNSPQTLHKWLWRRHSQWWEHWHLPWWEWCLFDDLGTHILLLYKIFHWLEANGFTVNQLKCKWAIQETDWLGYWLTPIDLKIMCKKLMASYKCQNKKILYECAASLVLSFTTNACGHNLHTSFGKKTFCLNNAKDFVIKSMKALMAQDCWLAYPNFNTSFHRYDISSYWMGANMMSNLWLSGHTNSMTHNWNTQLETPSLLSWYWQNFAPCI